MMIDMTYPPFNYLCFRHPKDKKNPRMIDRQDALVGYYATKAATAASVHPRRILEIGVRAGYSAAAFLHSAPTATYVGIDVNRKGHGGVPGMIDHAREVLPVTFPDAAIEIHEMDSQAESTRDFLLALEKFDLIHIDGDHSIRGCLSDLRLARELVAPGKFILVDDLKMEPVAQAVNKFTAETGWSWAPFPTLTSEALFTAPQESIL